MTPSIKKTVERLHETRFFYANQRRRVGADANPTAYEMGQSECAEIAKQLKEAAALIERLAGALALCIDNCVDLTEGEVALTRAREVLSGEPT